MKLLKPKRILAVLLSLLVVAELFASVFLGTVAQDTGKVTVEKELMDLSSFSTAEDISESSWPQGISKIKDGGFVYDSGFTVDIAEDGGEKYLKLNMNERNTVNNVSSTTAYMTGRGCDQDVFIKATISADYIPYLKDIKLDYIYNYKGYDTTTKSNAYYILGIGDGTQYGKDIQNADVLSPSGTTVSSGTISKNLSDMKMLTAHNMFIGRIANMNNYSEWTADDLSVKDTLDVIFCFSAPEIKTGNNGVKAGYYFGIKGISVTLEATQEQIDNLGKLDPTIITFDEGDTIAEVKANNKFGFAASNNSTIITQDAYSGNNAFLFKRWKGTSANDNDSNFSLNLVKNITLSQGITFMVKNISDRDMTLKLWISPTCYTSDTTLNGIKTEYYSKGKYQYVIKLAANQTEYERVTIYWNNVGLMDFQSYGYRWGTTNSSGHSITQEELESGLRLRLRNVGWTMDDAGVQLDEFKYITDEFTAERTVDLVSFQNCDAGGVIPSNISFGGSYSGTPEIIERVDGKKALKLNYDVASNVAKIGNRDMTLMYSRDYYEVAISVPKGALEDLKEIKVDMENTRTQPGVCDTANSIYTDVLYTVAVGSESDLLYGKYGEKATVMSFYRGDGSTDGRMVITAPALEMLAVSKSGLSSYNAASKTDKITEDFLKEIDTVYLLISAPNSDGKTGDSVVINSIELYYNEAPKFNEKYTRNILYTENAQPTLSDAVSVNTVAIGTDDPNSEEFNTAYEINITDASNTQSIVFKNELSEIYRNLKPFYEKGTAVFHMFANMSKDTKFQLSFVDKNGAEVVSEIEIKASDSRLYSEAQIGLKAVFDEYYLANPESQFDLTDIMAVKVSPMVEEPCSINIAGVCILTGDFVKAANDPEKLKKVNLLNFDNCEIGSNDIPSNVTVTGYGGTKKIVKTADNSNALQVNLTDPQTTRVFQELHQNNKRTNIIVTVNVPKGSLENLKKVHFTITNNGIPVSEQVGQHLQTYCTLAVIGEGIYIKPGQNAVRFSGALGVPTTMTLNTDSCVAGPNTGRPHYWLNPDTMIDLTKEAFSTFSKVVLYIAIPDCMGTEGYNFQINSIDLEFGEKPAYNEPETRYVFDGENNIPKATDTTVSVKENVLYSNDINYRNIKKTYTVSAKKGNTAPIVITNALSKFLRNGESFLDTATFRMYYHTKKAQKLKITFEDFYGEKMWFEAKITASESDKFDELILPFKDIYEKFLSENPESKFSLTDILEMELLPLNSAAVEFKIASPGLWSKEPGSSSSAGNYYYALNDDSARVEAYNYNIADDTVVNIEYLNIQEQIEINGTRVPDGAKVLIMAKVTLKAPNGDLRDPAGRFYTSFKVPEGLNTNNIAIFEVFYDGSLKQLRSVFDANGYITVNDFFNNKTFAILLLDPSVLGEVTTDLNDDSDDEYWDYEYIGGEEVQDETAIKTPSKVVRKKKVIVYDEYYETDYTWLWITLAIVGVALAAATIVVILIIRKRRKQKKESEVQ